MKNVLLLLLISTGFWSCNRCNGVDCAYPPTLRFKLISQGQNVSATYRQARLYSAAGFEVALQTSTSIDSSLCYTIFIPATSNEDNTLYLVLNSMDTDTIRIATRTVMENCCTSTQPTSIRFNGQETIDKVDADNCHLFVKK